MPAKPSRADLGNIIRILRLTQPLELADFQEVTTAVVYPYGPLRALVARGPAAEVVMVP